ncbi:MAG: hypothetical protein GVY26_11670 [Bacteroidetes bacterium]|jgi:hypothetical protein|nr:hypothetical protein [Bacteroidota bacterium]
MPAPKSLFLLFVCSLLLVPSLNAQKRYKPDKWLGIHNMNFRNSSNAKEEPRVFASGRRATLEENSFHKALSFGIHYRLVQSSGFYQHFDFIAFDYEEKDKVGTITLEDGEEIVEPIYGSNNKVHQFIAGYQVGKLFPIVENLTADVGLRGNGRFNKRVITPHNSSAFPVDSTAIGLGLNLELGVNYKIGDHFVIGYHFIPAALDFFWHEEITHRPDLPLRQRLFRAFFFDARLAENVLSFGNISLSYVFERKVQKKLRKKKRRKRG